MPDRKRSRLLLLAGQATALGAMCAFLMVPGSALFLARYGADALPWTYLTVAVTGVAVTWAMKRAQRRVSLAGVAVGVLATYARLAAACWLLLDRADQHWVTFVLLVLFPLSIPIGFVLVGSQAGRLLDIREIKRYLPRVFAGFSVGFGVGGISAGALVGPLGGPTNLLAVDLAIALVFLMLVVVTARQHEELRVRPVATASTQEADRQAADRRALTRSALVLTALGYQVLSAAVTQLLDFMVWERAAARYPDPSDLARFMGFYGAAINIVGLVFVVAFAGRLLTRHGVGFGLAADPGGVLLLLVPTALVGLAAGVGSLAFFVGACATLIADISFTDGLTRTSINATYQALPRQLRLGAQTWVEAAGIPLALGLVGAFLLARQTVGMDVRGVALVTVLVTVVWFVLARWAHREYAAGVRTLVATRPWAPMALTIRDDIQRAAVDRLLASPDPLDVAVGRAAQWDTEPLAAAAPTADHAAVHAALAVEAERAAWLLDTLATPDGGASVDPLRQALHDELAASGDQVLAVLGLAYGHDVVTPAVRALQGAGGVDHGLDHEALELAVGHRDSGVVCALVDASLDETARRRGLGAPMSEGSFADRVTDLVVDAAGRWHEWLRICALYAAPVALGERSGPLAERYVDHPDPVVAETARWAVGQRGGVAQVEPGTS